MSLLSSLYTGTTGLQANSLDLSVVGDNIANSNTIGFKASRAAFENELSQGLVGGGQLGLGTRLQAIQKLITQGALTHTGLATDLALQGTGFFVVRGANQGIDGQYYTRAGQFTLDQDGLLTNLDGLRVQGYTADPAGNLRGVLGDLDFGGTSAQPLATANIQVRANLQSDATIPPAWDPTNPTATSNFTTNVTVYDSIGRANSVDIYYRRTGVGAWEWHAMTDGANVAGGTPGALSQIANGTLAYDSSGLLTAVTQASNFNPLNAVNPQALTFDFGDPTGTGGTGLAGVTQFAAPSAFVFSSQDGRSSGSLSGIQINEQGNVMGTFSNGEQRLLGQVAVANFNAADQLARTGGNLFTETLASGQPTVGSPGTGGRASVAAGALEQSNVDLAEEFVRMIAAQRGFQANAKTINTADQLLAELMTLKR